MAMYENSEGLDKEIERLTKRLSTLDPTGEEYKNVRFNLDSLYKLRNEQYKVETETDEKRIESEAELKQKAEELEVKRKELELKQRELDLADKKLEQEKQQRAEENDAKTYEIQVMQENHIAEMKSQRNGRIHDYICTGANLVVGGLKLGATILFALMVTDQGYKFEETGVPTSRTFKDAAKNAMDLVKDQFKAK